MSKIGKLPITIKESVTVSQQDGGITVTGPKGTLSFQIPAGISVQVADGVLRVVPTAKNPDQVAALFGLTRALVANMVKGVDTGFDKKLEMVGVGYRAQVQGSDLVLSVGFSHPVKIVPPQGVTFLVVDNTITVSGIDKELVGNTAARIRDVRPPEPYKGKGIKYQGEHIRRKAGKAAKAVGAK